MTPASIKPSGTNLQLLLSIVISVGLRGSGEISLESRSILCEVLCTILAISKLRLEGECF